MGKTRCLYGAMYRFLDREFRKSEPRNQYISGKEKWIRTIAHEMGEAMRLGVTASYKRHPHAPPRRKGVPYKDAETIEAVQKLRLGVKKGRLFIFGTDAIGGINATVETTPSTSALKRNPDNSGKI